MIIPASDKDLDLIYQLFEQAIAFQQQQGYRGWQSYDTEHIRKDVLSQQLYKVLSGNGVAGIFCVCLRDELIWRSLDQNDALYLHRIISNRENRSGGFFKQVLDWAIDEARKTGRKYIRMDTWAENKKLIAYYESYGFRFVENYTTENSIALPEQHRNLHVALLQLAVY
jgi:GNAT superfamily N-acetyltransferase